MELSITKRCRLSGWVRVILWTLPESRGRGNSKGPDFLPQCLILPLRWHDTDMGSQPTGERCVFTWWKGTAYCMHCPGLSANCINISNPTVDLFGHLWQIPGSQALPIKHTLVARMTSGWINQSLPTARALAARQQNQHCPTQILFVLITRNQPRHFLAAASDHG